jgi:hypothetical protein
VADSNQYLRLVIGGASFLLPSVLRYTIEQRDSLVPNDAPGGSVAAWRSLKTGRWPAYALDGGLRASRPPDGWQRALFLEATATSTVGLVIDEVQLLARGDVQVVNFTPPGPAPTRNGHLFTGAWVHDGGVTLVFEPRALIAYLQGLGD